MHIPDGFLDAKTSIAAGALAAAGLGVALRHARVSLPPRKVPLLGLSAAFVFVAQMVNFPVPGATSGHLIGGVLVAALLGPAAAVIVMSTVLLVQCFAFADGGVTALGANVLNMAIINGAGGGLIYAGLARWMPTLRGRIAAAMTASWIVTVLAAAVCAGELVMSNKIDARLAFGAMTVTHALIGVGEAAITGLVLGAIGAGRPELLTPVAAGAGRSVWPVVALGLLATAGIGIFVAPFAWQGPDGLEKTAQRLGLSEGDATWHAPLSNYQIPGVGNAMWATAAVALLGVAAVFIISLIVARRLVRQTAEERR